MGLISPPQVTDGTTGDASDVNGPVNIISAEFNGNIDDANIKTNAGISGSKLGDGTVTPTKMSAIKMSGVGGTYTASPPTANGAFLQQGGTDVGNFSGNAFDFTFPFAFPNGVLFIIVSNGDTGGGTPTMGVYGGTPPVRTGFRVTSSTASGNQRFNWFAVGW